MIDGGKARTLGGITFMMFGSGPPVAGQNAHVQLWNPAGSGKNLVLDALTYSSGANGGILLKLYNAALTTLAGPGQSKKGGGAVAVGVVNVQANAGTLGGATILGVNLSANTPITYRPYEPIVLPPGWGLNMIQTVLATDISGSFEWYEEPV
ncbi:hypothetical protein CAter10_2510 [Collimonas arenae]|uniref:hypothetical protein n=1 Tax=Collimonas arenae TaxID=279058 RepID=UPI000778749B|nr:hypothetical protein [Collimonas arenae]AMP00156.1 hypothetical protein CAter10_2510 [Collimonas arenae]